MSKMANLILLVVAVSLVLFSGCKEKPAPEVEPVEVTIVEAQPVENAKPVAPVEPAAPAATTAPLEITTPIESAAPAPVEEKKTEVPAAPVVSTVSDEKKPEEGGHDAWMTDYKVAMKKAADEKKDMLLDFSGSDWCKWCIQLDKEVFSQKEFIEAASKDFVFVMLDYPQDKSKMTPKLLAQNEQLQKKFRVQGFPTVLLTDVAGKPYAQTGYQAGGPKAYLAHLAELRKSKVQVAELTAKAESTELDDVEKAKLLDKAINLMSPEMVDNYYSDLIDKIIAYDSENKAGLRDNYLAKKVSQKAVEQLQAGNIDKGIEMIDKIISDYKISAQTTQEVYYLKALAIRSKGDDAAVLENLKKAVGAAPESQMGTYIEGIIKTHFSKPQPKPTPASVPALEPESTPQLVTKPAVEKTTE